jgi:hypothetical protein
VWGYAFTPPYVFMEWCLIKHADKFIIYMIRFFYCVVWRGENHSDWHFGGEWFESRYRIVPRNTKLETSMLRVMVSQRWLWRVLASGIWSRVVP